MEKKKYKSNKHIVYAEISIYNGNPILKGVYVDNQPILDFLKKNGVKN